MKLHDFKCAACDAVFEQFSDAPLVACTANGCHGEAQRQLGGHPAAAAPKVNQGGYERRTRFTPFGKPIDLTGCAHPDCKDKPTMRIGIGLLEVQNVPKAKA